VHGNDDDDSGGLKRAGRKKKKKKKKMEREAGPGHGMHDRTGHGKDKG
jgi:hypothetical protein